MNRKELKKLHSLECKNMQWSWIFVNHKEKFIVVQIFQEQNKNKVYSPEWGNKTQASHSEYKEYLDLVRYKDYTVKAVQAKGYLDPNTDKFVLEGYYGSLLDARLEIDINGNIYFYPRKNGVEYIINRKA